MFVNVSRSKILVNNPVRRERKRAESAQRCNHCGGLLKTSGDAMSCIMCAREADHICNSCSHVAPGSLAAKTKKSA